MNKYLIKIAKALEELKASGKLPYRDRVEVFIFKNDKVLLTKNKDKETGDEWWGLPGGGVDNQTETEAAKNECLEEVGIKVDNLKRIQGSFKEEGGMSKKENRHLIFKGSITKWYTADYVEVDKSKLGDDGDSRQYRWQGLSEALQALKGSRSIATHRVTLLKALKPVKSV